MAAPRSRAVVERRINPVDDLDLFPTPPWATRAFFEAFGWSRFLAGASIWEPASGLGHMADVCREYAGQVWATDVHDYGFQDAIGSFVGEGLDVCRPRTKLDWIITNPPFNLGEEFFEAACEQARIGFALLLRTAWLDGQGRYQRIFRKRPPHHVVQFADRVPMVKGRWDPAASTATAYAWFVWRTDKPSNGTELTWVPSGAPARLSSPLDIEEFAARRPKGSAE